MKIYWWQAGIHIEPECKNDRDFRRYITSSLDGIEVKLQIPRRPERGVNTGDKQSVV